MKTCLSTLLLVSFALSSCLARQKEAKTESSGIYSVFSGIYQSENGNRFIVSAKDSILMISSDSINLYKYSDSWSDERVQKCNSKSILLIKATVENDRTKIAELFGDSPIEMNEYIDQYLNMHKDVLLATPKPVKFEIENTFYVDEISNHGHEANGWRWTTYCRVYWKDGRNRIIRFNWQPKTYFIDEWGLDKPVPCKKQMIFKVRPPFRSRINVYDPASRTTKLLRNIDKNDRDKALPARFVSYNID